MKHLRSKLFLGVGSILLVVAVLNYFLPEVFVRKELDKASVEINEHLDEVQNRLARFSSFLISYRIVESAAEMDGVIKLIASEENVQQHMSSALSPWQLAGRIVAYNPQMAFVQITDATKKSSVVIASEDAPLYSPLWAPFEQGMLWIKIPNKDTVFVAIPTGVADEATKSYLLFDLNGQSANTQLSYAMAHAEQSLSANYRAFDRQTMTLSLDDSLETLYKTLLANETEWVEKMDLIEQLVPYQHMESKDVPAGILKVNSEMNRGGCVLTSEVFVDKPLITDFSALSASTVPFLLLSQGSNGKNLDMARSVILQDPVSGKDSIGVGIGFSLSTMIRKLAQLANRPVIVNKRGEFSLVYNAEGKEFEMDSILPASVSSGKDKTQGTIVWKGTDYVTQLIDLHEFNLVILTPKVQATAFTQFLAHLRLAISEKISLSLLGAALLSLFVALILLNRISRKITKPIVQLSKASEELGKGKYDEIVLPDLGSRQDEIAVLTHSFENMVGALRDRDKIRGVLNKVVSKEISEQILSHNIELGGEVRTLTMLFSDIRGFTHLSEHLNPQVLIGMLNEYMTRMCRIIDETHGVVDKFVGDEIMALYGAPLKLDNHAVKAIEAAMHMIQHLRVWNEQRQKEGKFPFEIGIGIHTGVVCAGNMGAENRLNYTVIGSSVNLAARLCGHASPMQILISEQTWKEPGVQEKFRFKALDPVMLKGIDHPVPIFELQ